MASLLEKAKNTVKKTAGAVKSAGNAAAEKAKSTLKSMMEADDVGFQSKTSTRSIVDLPNPVKAPPSNKAMVFDVGAGMKPEEKKKAESVIKKQVENQKKTEAFVKEEKRIIPQPVKNFAKSVAPKTYENLATLRSKDTTPEQKITAALETPFRAPQEVILQPAARTFRGLTEPLAYGGQAEKVPTYQPKSWLAKQIYGEGPVESLYEKTVRPAEMAADLAKNLPQVKSLPEDSFTRRGLPLLAGTLAAGGLGGLEGTNLDLGLGGAASKGGRKLLQEGTERLVKEGTERLTKEGTERLVQQGAEMTGTSFDDLLRKIDLPKEKAQGKVLSREELTSLNDTFANTLNPENQEWRGVVYERNGGGKDVVIGKINDTFVVAELGKDGKPSGRVRTHSTPIKSSGMFGTKIYGKIDPNDSSFALKEVAERTAIASTDNLSRLAQEAKEYSTQEEFIKAKTSLPKYATGHRPSENGVRGFDLTEKVDGEQMIPKDMYEQWYGSRGDDADMESIQVLKKIKGKPDADVTIYRASPSADFNYGDWITLSKRYAKMHAESNLEKGAKVYSKTVKAKDIRWAMDDINEFGYYPESYKTELAEAWKNANKSEAFGAVAGVQPEFDEQGNMTGVGYDPRMGALGVAGVSFSRSKAGRELLEKSKSALSNGGRNLVTELNKAKTEYIDNFLSTTEDGLRLMDEFETVQAKRNSMMEGVRTFIDPKNLANAIKNTPVYRKEKSPADWMREAKIMAKNEKYRLAFGNDADRLASQGYKTVGYMDELTEGLGYEDGELFLRDFLEQYDNKQSTNIRSLAAKRLQETDPNFRALNEQSLKVKIERPPEGMGFRAEGREPTPDEITDALDYQPVKAPKLVEPEKPTLKEPVQLRGITKQRFDEDIVDEASAMRYAQKMASEREGARGLDSGKKKADEVWKEIKTKLVDSTTPITDALDAAEKRLGMQVLPRSDIRLQIDRVLRAPTLAGQFAKDNGLERVIQSFKNGDELDLFDQFLTARHAVDLESRGIETGRDIVRDRQLVQVMGPRFEEMAKNVTNYSQRLLDYSVQNGLISKDLADELKKIYPNYVPMNRVFSVLEKTDLPPTTKQLASLNKQTVVQKIVGSEREVESPLASLINKTNDAFVEGERNAAARMLGNYANIPDFPIRELKEGEKALHTISFLDNGKKRVFETTKEIEDAAKSLSVEQLGLLEKGLRLPVRLLKTGTTGINPAFILANLGRDQITGLVNTEYTTRALDPRNFLRAIFSAVKHDEYYDDLVRNAGLSTSFDVYRTQPKKTLESIRAGRNLPSKIKYTVRHPGELLRAVEDVFGRTEELTRIQHYKAAYDSLIAQGRTVADAKLLAAKAARDNTANFARRGSWGKVIGAAFPYVNAGIQGTRSSLRAARRNPVAFATKFMTLVSLPMAAATAWNLSDPERAQIYRDIQEYEKENNLILIPPGATQDAQGNWNIIKIPLPPGLGNLVQPLRLGIEEVKGVGNVDAWDALEAGLGLASPFNLKFTDSDGFNGSELSTSLASNLTPQIIKPGLENFTNTKFFTRAPVVPANLEKLPPEMQYRDRTSGVLRKIGQQTGMSPLKLENWITGTFGSVSNVAMHYVDALAASMGVIPEDQISGQGVVADVTRRYQKARGGAIESQGFEDVGKAVQNQEAQRAALSVQAEELNDKFKAMTDPAARAKEIQEIKQNNPALYKEIEEVRKDEKMGLTPLERSFKKLNVENGARAKFLDDYIQREIPKEKRGAYVKELKEKKIISPKVEKQMIELRTGSGAQPTSQNQPQQPGFFQRLRQRLGSLSGKYESGGDPGRIGYDNTGGWSYGAYQLAHRNALSFIQGSRYAPAFRGLTFNSPAWRKRWQEVAKADPEGFEQAQYDYTIQSHLGPQVQKLARLGVQLDQLPQVLQEVIFSTAVQHGPENNIIASVFRNADGKTQAQIIQDIYRARWSGGANFASSTPNVKRAVYNRFFGKNGEMAKALSQIV